MIPRMLRYVNRTCMEYTIQKTPHITFSKWYNKEKGWEFHHKKTGQSFMDKYFMFHASGGFWIGCVWTICRRHKKSNLLMGWLHLRKHRKNAKSQNLLENN